MFRKQTQSAGRLGFAFFVLACLLLAPLHASAHLLSGNSLAGTGAPLPGGSDCTGCVTAPTTGPVQVPHLETAAPSHLLELCSQPIASAPELCRITDPRAPPSLVV